MFKGMDNTLSSTVVSISLIAISAILTALNVFNRIGKFEMFTVAGPVLVFGISTSVIIGIIAKQYLSNGFFMFN